MSLWTFFGGTDEEAESLCDHIKDNDAAFKAFELIDGLSMDYPKRQKVNNESDIEI